MYLNYDPVKRLTGAGKDTGMYIILLFLLYLAGRCVEQTGRARAPAYSGEGHMDPCIRQEGERLFCPDDPDKEHLSRI